MARAMHQQERQERTTTRTSHHHGPPDDLDLGEKHSLHHVTAPGSLVPGTVSQLQHHNCSTWPGRGV